MQQISQGAEAIVYRDGNKVIKDRVSKKYRLAEIDHSLRQFRTRREAKVLDKLGKVDFSAPKLITVDDKQMKIEMEFIEGKKLRDILNNKPHVYGYEIGKLIGQLHSMDIIHDDLTTSNMILHKDKIHLIDFGLSFFSQKPEDKAVDLHLLERALDSKHYSVRDECMNAFISGYKEVYKDAEIVLTRLERVSLRGRNKKK